MYAEYPFAAFINPNIIAPHIITAVPPSGEFTASVYELMLTKTHTASHINPEIILPMAAFLYGANSFFIIAMNNSIS